LTKRRFLPLRRADLCRDRGTEGPLDAFSAKPTGKGPYLGVIVISENRSVTDYIQDVTKDLAKEGCVGLAVNHAGIA
jgi:dienelactone hydrolase